MNNEELIATNNSEKRNDVPLEKDKGSYINKIELPSNKYVDKINQFYKKLPKDNLLSPQDLSIEINNMDKSHFWNEFTQEMHRKTLFDCSNLLAKILSPNALQRATTFQNIYTDDFDTKSTQSDSESRDKIQDEKFDF